MDLIDRIIKAGGGVCELARKMEVHQSTVSQWRRRGRIPAKQARSIERVLKGKVTADEILRNLQIIA